MRRRRHVPKAAGVRAAPVGWVGLLPIVGLCGVALVSAIVAFGGRGGVEAASGAACVTDAVPGQFETWTAFFRRYPFDDAFLKARIEDANGEMPGDVVTIPLSAEAACGQVVSGE